MNKDDEDKIDEECFAVVSTLNNSLMITFVDSNTEKIVSGFLIEENFKQFLETIPNLFKETKAVILNVYHFENSEFSNNLEFRRALKFQLNSIQKPHNFMDEEEFFLSYLINEKILESKTDEIISYIWQCHDIEGYGISDYCITEKGYEKIDERQISADENDAIIFDEIIGCNDQKQILLIDDSEAPPVKKLEILLNGMNLKVLEITDIFPKATVNVGKWILDKNQPKKMVVPSCSQRISIGYFCDNKYMELDTVKDGQSLPVTKSCYISKEISEVVIAYHDSDDTPPIILEKLQTFKDCHQNQILFTLDEQNFPTFKVVRHFIEEICTLPKQLNGIMKSKIPVIGFCDNFAVICVYKKFKKCYNFFGDLNGLLGNDLFVSFDQEKPIFGRKAMEKLSFKPSFVVFDLINIMSMQPDNIKTKPQWGFTITKDPENQVLIEFDNFDGNRKTATPAFIMSLFLKENLNAIKVETGRYPKKLGFWLYGSFEKDEKERVQNGLEAACKLLKIGCRFIDA